MSDEKFSIVEYSFDMEQGTFGILVGGSAFSPTDAMSRIGEVLQAIETLNGTRAIQEPSKTHKKVKPAEGHHREETIPPPPPPPEDPRQVTLEEVQDRRRAAEAEAAKLGSVIQDPLTFLKEKASESFVKDVGLVMAAGVPDQRLEDPPNKVEEVPEVTGTIVEGPSLVREEPSEEQKLWDLFEDDVRQVKNIQDAVMCWKTRYKDINKQSDDFRNKCSVALSIQLARELRLPADGGPAEAMGLIKAALARKPQVPPANNQGEVVAEPTPPKAVEAPPVAPVVVKTAGAIPEGAKAFLEVLMARKAQTLPDAVITAAGKVVRDATPAEAPVTGKVVSRSEVLKYLEPLHKAGVHESLADWAAVVQKVGGSQFVTFAMINRAKVVP